MHKKWALITGATSGIGWASAKAFARAGYSILALGRRQERLDELQKILSKESPSVDFVAIAVDIREQQKVQSLLQKHADKLAQLEILLNSAGLAKGTDKMQEGHLQDWDEMVDINIKALLSMTRLIIPHMIQNKKGHVINIGSVAGRWTYPGGGVYCATKFAVRALTEGLRLDLIGTGVRVTNIEPGMVNTEFSLVRLGDQNKADQVYERMQPLTADDIADTILWTALRPAHINIQELVIFPTDQAGVGFVHRRS